MELSQGDLAASSINAYTGQLSLLDEVHFSLTIDSLLLLRIEALCEKV